MHCRRYMCVPQKDLFFQHNSEMTLDLNQTHPKCRLSSHWVRWRPWRILKYDIFFSSVAPWHLRNGPYTIRKLRDLISRSPCFFSGAKQVQARSGQTDQDLGLWLEMDRNGGFDQLNKLGTKLTITGFQSCTKVAAVSSFHTILTVHAWIIVASTFCCLKHNCKGVHIVQLALA